MSDMNIDVLYLDEIHASLYMTSLANWDKPPELPPPIIPLTWFLIMSFITA